MPSPTLIPYQGQLANTLGFSLTGTTIIVLSGTPDVVVTSTQPGSPLANIYLDPYGTTQINQTNYPLSVDANGNYLFYAASGYYTLQVYGPNLLNPLILSIFLPGTAVATAPGGIATNLQYNDSGAFGGVANSQVVAATGSVPESIIVPNTIISPVNTATAGLAPSLTVYDTTNSGGSIANDVGIYIEPIAAGTTDNYQLYSVGTAPSYLAGGLTVGGAGHTTVFDSNGKVVTYDGQPTAGWGLPPIVFNEEVGGVDVNGSGSVSYTYAVPFPGGGQTLLCGGIQQSGSGGASAGTVVLTVTAEGTTTTLATGTYPGSALTQIGGVCWAAPNEGTNVVFTVTYTSVVGANPFTIWYNILELNRESF